jgi:hypothetical protein
LEDGERMKKTFEVMVFIIIGAIGMLFVGKNPIPFLQPEPNEEVPFCYLCNTERNLAACDDCKKDTCREHYIHDGSDTICIVDLHTRQKTKRAATDNELSSQQLSPSPSGTVNLADHLCQRITLLEEEVNRLGNNTGVPGYYIED